MSPKELAEAKQIASDLSLAKVRLGQLGMFLTMHALNEATRVIGYELADKIEAVDQTAKKDAARRAARFG